MVLSISQICGETIYSEAYIGRFHRVVNRNAYIKFIGVLVKGTKFRVEIISIIQAFRVYLGYKNYCNTPIFRRASLFLTL